MGQGASKSQLPKEDLDYLLKKTSLDAKEIKNWYKVFAKECPNGELDRDQFVRIYSELAPGGESQSKLYEHIFRTYDQDGSGHIDFKEFIEAINITRSTKPEDKLRMAFRLYDVDQNGCVEENEMVEVMKAIMNLNGESAAGPDVEEKIRKRARKIFDIVDKNKQGYVTVDELVHVCLRQPDVYNLVVSAGGGKR